VVDELVALGVRIKDDRDQAWRDFAGWRVNYDVALLALCGLVMAPAGQWSSDRSIDYRQRLINGRLLPGTRARRWRDVRRTRAARASAASTSPTPTDALEALDTVEPGPAGGAAAGPDGDPDRLRG
jgi:hypothetical protein